MTDYYLLMAKEQSDGLLYHQANSLLFTATHALSLPSCLFKLNLFLTCYIQCLAVIIILLCCIFCGSNYVHNLAILIQILRWLFKLSLVSSVSITPVIGVLYNYYTPSGPTMWITILNCEQFSWKYHWLKYLYIVLEPANPQQLHMAQRLPLIFQGC